MADSRYEARGRDILHATKPRPGWPAERKLILAVTSAAKAKAIVAILNAPDEDDAAAQVTEADHG